MTPPIGRTLPPRGAPSLATPSRTAVLLSGGAPTMHFISGALSAFHEAEISFDVIAASGAGALPGLLFAAPKEGNVRDALRKTVELNVDDLIYDKLPMNFKVFQKEGPFSKPMWELFRRFSVGTPEVTDHYQESLQRLVNDSIQLVGALMTPSTLNYWSKSMCTRIDSFLDDVVAWDDLKNYDGEFVLNAFNLDKDRLEVFAKHELNSTAFFAALAMCWLYPPSRFNGTTYTEGASHDPSAIEALWNNPHTEQFFDRANSKHIDTIIAIETVRPDMWRGPRDLYDALQLTIMDPLVALTEQMLSVYGRLERELNRQAEARGEDPVLPKLYIVPFTLPSWAEARAMDWNYSNGLMLWDTGYDSAREFCRAYQRAKVLPPRTDMIANPFHPESRVSLDSFRFHDYARGDQARARRDRYLSMYDDLFELISD